jgi:hypothetical protein
MLVIQAHSSYNKRILIYSVVFLLHLILATVIENKVKECLAWKFN